MSHVVSHRLKSLAKLGFLQQSLPYSSRPVSPSPKPYCGYWAGIDAKRWGYRLMNDLKCKNAKPRDKAYKISDSRGLYLHVLPTGMRVWRWNFRVNGSAQTMNLGRYPELSLTNARLERAAYDKITRSGLDPRQARQPIKQSHADVEAARTLSHGRFQDGPSGACNRHALRAHQAHALPSSNISPGSKNTAFLIGCVAASRSTTPKVPDAAWGR